MTRLGGFFSYLWVNMTDEWWGVGIRRAMAIPETLQSLEHVTHIDRRVTRFVVPLATSINRDGSCIFLAVSCIFIAHISDMELGAAGLVLLWYRCRIVCLCV